MKSTVIRCSTAAMLAVALLPAAAWAEKPEQPVTPLTEPVATPASLPRPENAHPFAALGGSWTGGGTISLTNDINERLRCRATYTHRQGTSSLSLSIRCASDNYKFELSSNVVERRGQISGQWQEASYNVSGTISGRVAGNRITAVAQGDSFNADLSVTTSGNRQSVTITPKGTYLTNVQITLSRR
jgi:hypothetical protein